MDTEKAWEIVHEFYRINDYSEDELIVYEEALNFILFEAIEMCEEDDFDEWKTDVEAGAYNLACHYESIGKYELAIKYYNISKDYGCSFADDKIERLKAVLNML